MEQELERQYHVAATTPGDIVEHIPILYKYAQECDSIAELGVSACVSTWAFIKGLYDNGKQRKRLLCSDVRYHPNIEIAKHVAANVGVDMTFMQCNDLDLDVSAADALDMTFIDTWHVYGQLKRELAKFAPLTRKYIIMHDTTIDAEYGESIRDKHDIIRQSRETGIPIEEISKGLRYAIEEFLQGNPEWETHLVRTNNNGLTVLKRKEVA